MKTLHQIALLQSMATGDFYGHKTVGETKKLGDFGIGTFYQLDGELILLDGLCYQAKGDGSIALVSDEKEISFATISFFEADFEYKLNALSSIDALLETLNRLVFEKGQNRFYAVKIEGFFSSLKVRTAYPQTTPYERLDKILPTNQRLYEYTNQTGTLVGLYCPTYMNTLNMPGWHFHFLSEDKTKGGHLVNLTIQKAKAFFSMLDQFLLHLPETTFFHQLDLGRNLDEIIHHVEKTR